MAQTKVQKRIESFKRMQDTFHKMKIAINLVATHFPKDVLMDQMGEDYEALEEAIELVKRG